MQDFLTDCMAYKHISVRELCGTYVCILTFEFCRKENPNTICQRSQKIPSVQKKELKISQKNVKMVSNSLKFNYIYLIEFAHLRCLRSFIKFRKFSKFPPFSPKSSPKFHISKKTIFTDAHDAAFKRGDDLGKKFRICHRGIGNI